MKRLKRIILVGCLLGIAAHLLGLKLYAGLLFLFMAHTVVNWPEEMF